MGATGRGRANREGAGRGARSVHSYENRTVKPAEIILSREREVRENDGGNESNQDSQ
jgi:hypothetical protein